MQLTGRPKEWDFDLNDQHNYSRFTKAAIRKGEAKIRTVGGLCAGIVPIKNELNRTTSYFVYVSEASKEWKKNHADLRNGTLTTFPKLDIEELQEHYLKFIFSQTLNKDLSENPTKPRKLKI